ncbi:RNA methyltransferase [Mycoplasmatota bacterium WC44]
MSDKILLEGFISIKSAINSKNRDIEKVYISNKKRTRKSSYMKKLLTENNIDFDFSDYEKIDALANGSTHGGFVAVVSDRKFLAVRDLLKMKKNYIFYIEGIEDPFNLGSTIRTLYAAGIGGVILKKRDWSKTSAIISKSSAGTFEKMDIAICDDIKNTLSIIKNSEYSIISATQDDESVSLFDTEFKKKTVVVIGGEKRGITCEILEASDKYLHIPYGNDQFGYSLPASTASTIISYEILRQITKG